MITEQVLVAAWDALPSAVMILDHQHTIQWTSQRFNQHIAPKIAKYSPMSFEQWQGKDFYLACRADTARSSMSHCRDKCEFSLSYGDGHFHVLGTTFQAPDVAEPFIVLTWNDVSEQKRFNKNFAHSSRQLAGGNLLERISVPEPTSDYHELAEQFNQAMESLNALIDPLAEAIDTMAECNLNIQLDSGVGGRVGQLYSRFNVSLSNLTEALRQTTRSSDHVGVATGQIVEQNEQLSQRTDEQAKSLEITATNINQLSSTVANTADNARQAVEEAQHANHLADEGRKAVNRLVEVMEDIHANSIQASEIVDIINSIAFQTNILSLNATIEAARAGIHGRSFNVVAREVRNLSKRTAEASNQIRTLMKASEEMSQQGVVIADHASKSMTKVLDGVSNANSSIEEISQAAKEQSQGINNVKQAIDVIDDITHKNHSLVVELGKSTLELDRQARYLKDASQVFRLNDQELSHPFHQQALVVAQSGAKQISRCLGQAIRRQQLSDQALFESEYYPISGTNPQQFRSDYDHYTDELFPTIQEPLLDEHEFLIYAIAIDQKAYVPTHNNTFAQPSTGKYEHDLKYCRSKRIYNDRVGELSAQHEEAWKLQTYRRDTGELMFDMSVPIKVNNRHYGAFRVGYRIE